MSLVPKEIAERIAIEAAGSGKLRPRARAALSAYLRSLPETSLKAIICGDLFLLSSEGRHPGDHAVARSWLEIIFMAIAAKSLEDRFMMQFPERESQ